jgi:hypothetical protein
MKIIIAILLLYNNAKLTIIIIIIYFLHIFTYTFLVYPFNTYCHFLALLPLLYNV